MFDIEKAFDKKKIQVVQTKILKIIFNLPWDTPTEELHQLAQVELVVHK